MPVCPNRLGIGRHRVVREVACNHRAQPSALFGDAVAASVAQLRLYFLQVCTHAAAGEVVIFYRSWYNRAGVERVMGFCDDEQASQAGPLSPSAGGVRGHQ